MKKRERKTLGNGIKEDIAKKKKSKAELANEVFDKLENRGEKGEKEVKKKEPQSKLTVLLPESYHDKLKRTALDRKKTQTKLIIEYIESL